MAKNPDYTVLRNRIEEIVIGFKSIPHDTRQILINSILTELDTLNTKHDEKDKINSYFFEHALDLHCIAGFDGYFKTLNHRWSQILGWSEQEMLSKPWIEFVHPDDKEISENTNRTIINGKEIFQFENRYLCKDGNIKWLSWNARPDTQNKQIYSVVRDITESKKNELLILESEERFRLMFESAKDAIILLDPTDKEFMLANQTWYKMFGYEKSYEITGLNPWNISPKNQPNGQISKELAISYIEQCIEKGVVDFEWQHKRSNGELFYAHILLVKMVFNGKVLLQSTVRDITESKLNQQKLKENLNKTQALLKAIPDLMFVINREKVFVDFYASYEQLLISPPQQFLNNSVDDALPPYIAKLTNEKIDALFSTREMQEYGYSLEIDNEINYFDVRMVLLDNNKGLAIVRDITKEKRVEISLTESEAKYKMLFESNKDGLAIFSILPGGIPSKFIEANFSTTAMFGYSPEELNNMSPSDLEIEVAQEDLFTRIKDLKENGFVEFETKIKHKNGTLIDVEIKSIVINYKGKPSILNITRNISARKAIELELRESEERYKTLHNSSFGGIAIHDKGVILECNYGLSAMFGYSYDELIGMDGLLLLEITSRSLVMEKIMTGIEDPYEAFGLHKDGTVFPLRIEARNVPYKGKLARVVEFRDITKQKEDEKTILINKNLLQKTQELAKIGGWEWNIKEQVMTWTNEVYRIHDIEPANANNSNDIDRSLECYLPDDRELIQQAFDKCVEKGIPYDLELQFRSLKGRNMWVKTAALPVYENGEIVKVSGHIIDITDRKQAEVALRKSEENLRNLVSQMEQGLAVHEAIFDKKGKMIDYRYISVNPSFEKITGLKHDEIIGKTILEIMPGIEKYWIENYETVVKTGKSLHYENYSKDSNRYYDVIAYKNKENQFAVITTDITERYKSEEKLRLNNYRINSIFKVAPTGIGITIDRVITELNPRLCEMTGYSHNELLGKSSEILYPTHSEYKRVGIEKYKRIKEFGIGTIETTWKRKDGSLIDILLSSTPIVPDDISQGVTFTATEITKQKQEERIMQSQIRLFEMVENDSMEEIIATALANVENLTNSKISFFLLYNETTNQITLNQWSKNTFGDVQTTKDHTHKSLPIDESEIWIDCIRKRKPIIYNNYSTVVHKKGVLASTIELSRILTIPIIRKKRIVAILGLGNKPNDYRDNDIEISTRLANLVWEVTERKKAEEQILKLSVGIEQSPTMVVITDKNGKIEYINPRFTDITGYAQSDVIGKNPKILKSGKQNSEFYKNLWETISSGNNWKGELINMKKDGSFYWEHAHISPIKDSQGVISNYIALKEDITERKENDLLIRTNERKLKEQNEEYITINAELLESNKQILQINKELTIARLKAEESDKLKTAFLANISHEIRTPLNGIIGFSKMLQKPNLALEKVEYFQRIIKNSSDQLLNIINDVIDIAKIEAGQIEIYEQEVNINHEIQKYTNIFAQPALLKNIEIRVENALPDESAILFTDLGKFNQIINNLLNNALKFTSKGSITIGYEIKEPYIQFFVKDTGIGISPEHQDVIFDRFRQVEIEETRQFGGTGLGLSITKAFVEAMRGQIWVESDAYIGSNFYFTLPFEKGNTSIDKNELAQPEVVYLDGKKVLIAEDEETNLIYIKEILAETRAQIILAHNGLEAIILTKEHQPDLILMDIKMPEMDGLTATSIIKKEYPNTPIIATTAYALTGDRLRCLNAGCDGYLSKPLAKEELLILINKLLVK